MTLQKKAQLQSRRTRRLTVISFYISWPLWFWLLNGTEQGGALPEGFGWYGNLEPWLALGFFVVLVFCFVKLFGSSVGGIFGKNRDERQQIAFARAYSLSYRILSGLIFIPGIVFCAAPFFVTDWPVLTLDTWILIISSLIVVVASLPKAVAMWLEPDPLPNEPTVLTSTHS